MRQWCGLAADVYVAPFNTVNQSLIGRASECVRFGPDVVFVAQLLEDVCPRLADEFLTLSSSEAEHLVDAVAADVAAAIATFRGSSAATVVVHNYAQRAVPALGLAEPAIAHSQTDMIRLLNHRLRDALSDLAGVHVLDFDRVCADIGYRVWRDDRMWDVAKAPLSAQALPRLARTHAQFLRAIRGQPARCLVVDLDDTLWGGIVGEVGVNGIELGTNYPGSGFRRLQAALLHLSRRGVLLAVNSKNNPADVEEVLSSHPDMILRRENFAAMRVNWQPKHLNMVEIADELGLGLESLAFFDDSPQERLAMTDALPEVHTLDVPRDPAMFAETVLECGLFDRLTFTAEDRQRGEMYQQQARRSALSRSALSLETYLASLEMKAEIKPIDDTTFPRVLELIGKTNQCNLTTRRYGAQELRSLVEDEHTGVFHLRLFDRFGDNGLVGVVIVRETGSSADIDSLLLSCRVIGRNVETALLAFVVEWARERSLVAVEGTFAPTAKNAPVADLYPRHGFAPHERGEDGTTRWHLDLGTTTVGWPAEVERLPGGVAVP